jgi:uncharacterized protein
MSTGSNKLVVQRMYEALAAGDPAGFWDGVSDDVEYVIIGTTVASGTFRGKRELIDKVMKPLGRKLQGAIALAPVTIVGDGDTVVVELTGTATARSGRRYDNVYCQVLKVADGKVRRVTEYLDTELVTAVFGPRSAAINPPNR